MQDASPFYFFFRRQYNENDGNNRQRNDEIHT